MFMHLRLHVPSSIDVPDDWNMSQRERLQQVVGRAFARAVSMLDLSTIQIELVSTPEQVAESTTMNTAIQVAQSIQAQSDVNERIDVARARNGVSYEVPDYDSGGQLVDIPMHAGGEAMPGTTESDAIDRGDYPQPPNRAYYRMPGYASGRGPVEIPMYASRKETIDTSEGDSIDLGEFPHLAVIQGRGNTYIYAGGGPYVKAQNLARAMQWGAYLFGGSGYAILQPKGASLDGPFYVAPLLESLKLKGETGPFTLASGEKAVGIDAKMIHLQDYLSVAVIDSRGNLLFGNRLNDPWNLSMYKRALAHVPENQRVVDKSSVQEISGLLLSHAAASHDDEGMIEIIVKMDRTLFAAMPWEKRAEYLVLLLDAWTNEREEIAILEIIHATRSESELEAIFALLRERGKYEKLFDDLDGRVFELLRMLGEYRTGRPLDWHYLADLLIEMECMPSTDPGQKLELLAGGLGDWLQNTWDGIRFLFTNPGETLEGLGHLAELLWTVQQAQKGDLQAQAFVTHMVTQVGTAIAKAILGLQYAEELGTPYDHRGDSVNIGAGILGRLQAAFLFEVLSWFIGIGEIRAAVHAAGTLPERLAVLMEALRSLRLLGKAAEVGSDAAKLEHILVALAHIADVGEEARIVRLAEFLPQEHLALLESIAQSVELPQGAGIDTLRKMLSGKTELLQGVDRLGDALSVIGRVEARASSAGGITAEMAQGLQALLYDTGWDRVTLVSLIEDIPTTNLSEFLRTMTFVKPTYLQRWGVQALKEIAARPRVQTFIREAGSNLLEVAFGHTRRSWEEFETFLEGLSIKHNRTPSAIEYQRFLDRLAKDEDAAFDEVQRLGEAAVGNRSDRLTFTFDIDRAVQAGEVDERVLKRLVIESWGKGGGNSPVKVVSGERGASSRVRGYVTQRKYIEGKTPTEMGKILGLTDKDVESLEKTGAVVMELEQIPSEAQFGLRGYTQRPGGTEFLPGGEYPIGSGVPQWQLTDEIPAKVIGMVKPGEVFRTP